MNYYEQPRNRQGRWVRGFSKIKLVLWFGGAIIVISLVAYIYDTFAKANAIVDEYISEPIICEACNENKTLESKIKELKSDLNTFREKIKRNNNKFYQDIVDSIAKHQEDNEESLDKLKSDLKHTNGGLLL